MRDKEVDKDMKKIYTMLGQQKLNMQYYGDENGQLYEGFKEKVQWSLIVTLHNIIEQGEKFKVIVLDSFQSEQALENYKALEKELNQYFKDQYSLERIECKELENNKGQLKVFKTIYQTFEKGDQLYFDITFGLKPTPMLVMVACNYAYKFVEDISIKRIFYTLFDFTKDSEYVHKIIDMTSLFYLEQFLQKESEIASKDPTKLMDLLFYKE